MCSNLKPVSSRLGKSRANASTYVPMPYPLRPPLSALVSAPEETKPTITFGIDLASIQNEALCNRCLHLRYCSLRLRLNISTCSMATMHNKRSLVHSLLGSIDEIHVVEGSPEVDVVDEDWFREGYTRVRSLARRKIRARCHWVILSENNSSYFGCHAPCQPGRILRT